MTPSIILFSYMAPPILNAESILVGKTLRRLQKAASITCFSAGNETFYPEDRQMERWIEGIRMYRVPPFPVTHRLVRKGTIRALAAFGEYGDAWWRYGVRRAAKRDHGEYQLIYSRSHPGVSHMAAWDFKKKRNLPWIAGFSDPWAYNPYEQRTALAQRHVAYWEAAVVHQADHLIFPTEEIQTLFHATYPEDAVDRKSTVIPHGFEPDWYPQEVRRSDSRICLSYVGDFYGARSPWPLIQAVRMIPQNLADQLDIRLIGNVARQFLPLFEEAKERRGVFQLVGPVSYRESLEAMVASDALLVVDAPGAHSLFLPSKVVDYLGARRPIFGITPEGPTARILTAFGQPVVTPERQEDIAVALEDFIRHLDRYNQRILAADVSSYRMDRVVGKLQTVLAGYL